MAARRTYSTDLLPEETLPADLAERNLYRPAGFSCRRCSFTSEKQGFSGRQALRAHLKKHKNEDRAWQVPAVRQALVVATVVGVGVMGWLDVDLPESFQSQMPLLDLPNASAWALFGSAIGLALASAYLSIVEAVVGGALLTAFLRWVVGLGSLVGVWALSGIWGFVSPEPSLIILAPVVVLVAFTPLLAGRAGYVRLMVKRRQVRSGSYTAMVKPKNAEAGWESWLWWSDRHRGPQP